MRSPWMMSVIFTGKLNFGERFWVFFCEAGKVRSLVGRCVTSAGSLACSKKPHPDLTEKAKCGFAL